MSRFFNETQKARQWANNVADPAPLDVETVMEAIQQDEVEASDPLVVSLPSVRQIHVGKAIKDLITEPNINTPLTDPVGEAYRTLRTRVMRLQASKGIRSIMLTSAVPAEGKTVTALNLALSCAQLHDQRILLVDGDLRSRGLTRLLAIPDGVGLSDILSGKSLIDEAVLATEHKNFFVVGAGTPCGQPAELLASPRWSEFIVWSKQSFATIVVDTPPIHSLADAELISAVCDGVLLVVKAFSTPREMTQKCGSRIDKRKLMGIVFNGVPNNRENRYNYDGVSS